MTAARITAAALAALALAGCSSDPYAQTPATTPASSPEPLPEFSRAQINEQDQTSEAQRRREDRAMRDRPLLDHLPLTIGDAEISIYGLASDNRHTVLQITAPSKALGEQAYLTALHAYADRGAAYQPKYQTR